jgi:hypothetical protein
MELDLWEDNLSIVMASYMALSGAQFIEMSTGPVYLLANERKEGIERARKSVGLREPCETGEGMRKA